MILFQTMCPGVSVIICLHSITVSGAYLLNLKPPNLMIIASIFSISVYTVQALILFVFALLYSARLKLAAISLSVLTFILIIWHSL